jgi:hypothetical protein
MPRPPKWFVPVAVIALLWNLAGLAAVLADLRLTAADIDALPPAQQALYHARPMWSVVGSVLAVGAGSLGCLGLVVKKRWALSLLWASLAGILLQDLGLLVVSRVAGSIGTVAIVLQGVVLLIGIGLVLLARRACRLAWIA